MGRFDDRLSHPLPGKWQSARMLRTAMASRPWQPLGREGVPVAPEATALDQDGVQWLGHATCLLIVDGVRILTDPIFAPRVGPVPRAHPAPLPPEALRPDVVLISHDHMDHLDRRAARKFRGVPWRVPLGTERWCRRQGITDVEEFDWGEETLVAAHGGGAGRGSDPGARDSGGNDPGSGSGGGPRQRPVGGLPRDGGRKDAEHGVRLRFVGADHWCRRTANDRNDRLWGGWRIEGSWSAYFAGDTGNGPRFQHVLGGPAPELAMLPIGGCEPRWFMQHKHLNPEDVAQTMTAWPDTHVVPIHWGTYRIAIERLDSVKHRLDAAWHHEGRDPRRLHVLPVGGHWRRV